ncbi:winged helix-turn-helix transcriptional regulator [Actinocrispum wychmicini]|uniref:HxlR family transcriptional regulator n=1 Tax=Actinocrispum wychmicini TaxID=1213861 RepID=A0A4R2JKW8_9PSEU|nr:helix-turn-helix domain-containing protein [Actinocrispum wychmicini]TCO59487.1 HxlR family transcriptional regulator [Actinocrispum wychmicini]
MDKVQHDSKSPRSYGQFCALARALDIVGERWTLLIVRELLPGPMRYTELKTSLGGIATNLLAERLRALESNGIVQRRLGDAGVLYALTPWGAALREPMEALGRWGAPLVMTGRNDDSFQPRWLVLALPGLLRGITATPPVELGVETDGFLIVLRIDEDGPSAIVGPDQQPDTIFTAAPEVVIGLAAGGLTIEQALSLGDLKGDKRTLSTVFPPGRAIAVTGVSPSATDD